MLLGFKAKTASSGEEWSMLMGFPGSHMFLII